MFDGDEPVEIEIEYLDSGNGAFGLEYDSADQRKKGLAQRFCPGASRTLAGSGVWKTLRVVVPHARFAGRANGADFRLACVNVDLIVHRVAIRRPNEENPKASHGNRAGTRWGPRVARYLQLGPALLPPGGLRAR